MALFCDAERRCAEASVGLSYRSPFLPKRIEYETA
jgi:hypothetical protein